MILITGITGFLGQHLTQKLVQRGESIIGLSRKSGSLRVAGAVVLVFSPASIVIFVLSMVTPASLMSTVRTDPVGAVATLARTPVKVKA